MTGRIVWDFNGTILDDVAVGMKSINTVLGRYGLPPVDSLETYHRKFRFPIIDYYRSLGFDFDRIPYQKVADEWVAEYNKNCPAATVREGVAETMKALRTRGFYQLILSATESAMLHRQVEALGIGGLVDEILGCGDVYAYGKTELALRYRRLHPDEPILMVGDTVHDHECAQKAGFACVLTAGGHQSRQTLEALGAEVIDTIPALLDCRTLRRFTEGK